MPKINTEIDPGLLEVLVCPLTRAPLRRIQASSINGYFPYFLSIFLIKIFYTAYSFEFI